MLWSTVLSFPTLTEIEVYSCTDTHAWVINALLNKGLVWMREASRIIFLTRFTSSDDRREGQFFRTDLLDVALQFRYAKHHRNSRMYTVLEKIFRHCNDVARLQLKKRGWLYNSTLSKCGDDSFINRWLFMSSVLCKT